MTLEQKLSEDMKAAMKGKDMKTLEVLRMTIASVRNKAIELGKELSDADVMAVIKSDAKKIKDALESFATNAREDLAEEARKEIAILERYLPKQLTDGELEEKVRAKLAELGINDVKDIGKAMGALAKDLKEAADGSRIKMAVEKLLKKAE